ncbi:MAG: YiiX/YebB-like N1pC/P60 family cysteine hydrolase [Candidatus Thioglobus sp.]
MNYFVLTATALFSCMLANSYGYSAQAGDLLFQDIKCGALCQAIDATGRKHATHLSHIAMMVNHDAVIEAIGADVHLTKLQTFLHRSTDSNNRPLVIVGRLKPQYRKFIAPAVLAALSWQAKPYNYSFKYNNNFKRFYCSQLIYDAFALAANKPLFKLIHMRFDQNEAALSAWTKYFQKIHKKIPEGELGTNPNSILASKKIDIIYKYS